jgi:small subunit ribosomal protein S17
METADKQPDSRRRILQGRVISNKMAKTITVRVERTYKHPKYGKYVRSHKHYHAHDERGEAQLGDLVEVQSTRPLSKLKRWRLLRVVENARLADVAQATAQAASTGTTDTAGGLS